MPEYTNSWYEITATVSDPPQVCTCTFCGRVLFYLYKCSRGLSVQEFITIGGNQLLSSNDYAFASTIFVFPIDGHRDFAGQTVFTLDVSAFGQGNSKLEVMLQTRDWAL